ncbi:choline-binding transcriptional repressor BetI [Pseudogemmobacter sp. W21_MBD1_M6]|uniref:choline-binding transcriptional repressor BetI n=1 Tax=Pseudogemmobacter sp. W21_MBD1_M6 TaxID=3240271 RepID=UPI003F99F6C1
MPKLGAEPIRRRALVKATIAEVGLVGSLDVTVSQIAKRAGMSSALAHHYFGGKDQIFLAAMRHILSEFGAEVRSQLVQATTPAERLDAILRACFAPSCFEPATVSAWMTFYAQAQASNDARRLLRIYQRRLASNLTFALRPLSGDALRLAETLGSLIDGLYIRAALSRETTREQALDLLRGCVSDGLRTPK